MSSPPTSLPPPTSPASTISKSLSFTPSTSTGTPSEPSLFGAKATLSMSTGPATVRRDKLPRHPNESDSNYAARQLQVRLRGGDRIQSCADIKCSWTERLAGQSV